MTIPFDLLFRCRPCQLSVLLSKAEAAGAERVRAPLWKASSPNLLKISWLKAGPVLCLREDTGSWRQLQSTECRIDTPYSHYISVLCSFGALKFQEFQDRFYWPKPRRRGVMGSL